MASLQGRADVLSAKSLSPLILPRKSASTDAKFPLTVEDASSNLRAVGGLFAIREAPSQVPEEAQRGTKRRKLDNGNVASIDRVDFDEAKSIVLAKVTLDLNFAQPLQGGIETFDTSSDSQTRLSVSFESVTTAPPNAFRVVLWNVSTATGTEIIATTQKDFLNSITPHLRTAAALATSNSGKAIRPVPRAAFCRCELIQSALRPDEFRLEVEARWQLGLSVVEHPSVRASAMKDDLRLLSRYFRDATVQANTEWALSDFYDAVYVPPTDFRVSPRIQHSLAETMLYPFQQRAVDWLLRREGVTYSASGHLESFVEPSPPASFRQTQDATGKSCHISQLRGMAVSSINEAKDDTLQALRGGILAEEMGLGKTVELMALMAHHKRKLPEGNVFDAYTGASVKPSSATLIITPPSILEQWMSELHTHAPEMKVLHYKGLPSLSAPKKDHTTATVDYLMRYDVVLTTYNVLSKEIHHAKPPPDRTSRHGRTHERRASPLVGISWWRVCLDEAQMIESGVSQAATVARIIPRCNAWAVTGTPLRKDVQDLRGLLIFLRCDAFTNNRAVWDRLDRASFRAIFQQIALRHTKDKIRDELLLPPQKRVVITVPFTAIEDQHYTELIRQMCDSCWLTPEGIPLEEDRDVSDPEVIERMREWLVRLRQTCLHANVGRKNRRALGAKNGALRTVHEVLEVMIEQNDTSWKAEAREMILSQIKLGHVKAYAGNIDDRAQIALPYYEAALIQTQAYVATCREELLLELKKLGKAETSLDFRSTVEKEDEDEGEEKEGDNLGRLPVARKALRSFLELEHACHFFIATTYHQIKENEQFTKADSEEYHRLDKLESEWYQKAKVIRRELLGHSKKKAQQQMSRVSSRRPFHQIAKVEDLPGLGGIEARKILETMDNIGDFLNAQSQQIQTWRTKIVDILLLRLVDDDDDQETTGEEYDDSLKAQDELYVYIMALRTLIADRNAAINGLQDILVEHELKAAEKQAMTNVADEDNRGHAPELVIEVAKTRRQLQAKFEGGSLKGVVSGVRSLLMSLQWRADNGDSRASAELDVVKKHLAAVQTISSQQAKTITELDKEQEMFRSTMNQRLEYYRQFQIISDSVAKWKDTLDETFDDREFSRQDSMRAKKADKVAGLKTKATYLTHLRTENQSEAKAECIICQDAIEIGVLTTCGHKYCKVCINTWWHQHRTCPLCKQKLGSSDFKDISFKPSEVKAHEETQESASPTQASTPGTLSTSIYSDISDSTMKEIKMIDLDGSYGTKIDMIARHLIWIRNFDPGAKSIIFSQFGDFLEVLREALKKWKIGVSGITEKDGIQRFKSDPRVESFLLDAKSDSSGLNLVNATYVFLCEPLINPAIELQAIARVHRIGQQRPTTVFMYLVSDTVEEAIYDISVARRLEHIGKTNTRSQAAGSLPGSQAAAPVLHEQTLDAANSAELQAAPLKQLLRKKGDGEIVREDDLWKCLFGKVRKQSKPVLVLEREVDRHLRAEAANGRRDELVERLAVIGEGRF